jgi:deazaflavin-dependent oxidoreductase (nitroreductase family)
MGVNAVVERAVRTGIASPCLLGVGIVILETKGRVTGKARTVPLLAQRFGSMLLVSTVRNNSQWVRNVEADTTASVVLGGRSRPVTASVQRLGDWTLVRLQIAGEGHNESFDRRD